MLISNANRREAGILLMVAGTICFFANNHILSVAIPLLINDMGFPLKVVGQCTAAMGAVTIIMKFITPAMIKRIKLKRLIIADLICLSIITLAFILFGANSPMAITLLRALFGAPFSLFPVMNLIAITNTANSGKEMVKHTSLIGMAMPISMMLSPAITEYLLSRYTYNAVFVVALSSSIICLILYVKGLEILEKPSPSTHASANTAGSKGNFSKAAIPPIIAFFFLGIVDMLLLTYFPLLAEGQKRSYSFYFAIFAISMVISQRLYTSINITTKIRLTFGYVLLCLAIIAATVSDMSFYLLSSISALTFGIGYSLTETATNTLMMEKKANAPRLVTIQQLSICLGRTIGPWIISFFSADIIQMKKGFMIMSLSMLIPIILITAWKNDERNKVTARH